MSRFRRINKDSIIILSSGEYSDYSVHGLYRAKVDFDPNLIRDEYINLYPEDLAYHNFKSVRFRDYLKQKDLIEPLPSVEWFLDCSNISEMRIDDRPTAFM